MATKAQRIDFTAKLHQVTRQPDGKFSFRVEGQAGGCYQFHLSKEKALKIANQDLQFPIGVRLHIRGLRSATDPTAGLTFVKILSVDGHDVQSWAEGHQSPTVAPDVLTKAQRSIDEAEEENMRRRAPPDPAPLFKSPEEAYERAMYLLRRQVRLKNPKMSKSDIWAIRDALNMLKENLGKATNRQIGNAQPFDRKAGL
jgi:DNA-binding transcriptional regulator YiaG